MIKEISGYVEEYPRDNREVVAGEESVVRKSQPCSEIIFVKSSRHYCKNVVSKSDKA